jgi:hypothetical protein
VISCTARGAAGPPPAPSCRAGHVVGTKLITSLWPVALAMRCNVRTDGKLPPFSRRPTNWAARFLVRTEKTFRWNRTLPRWTFVVNEREKKLKSLGFPVRYEGKAV